HPSWERYADGSVLVEIPYASEEWLVREGLKHQGDAVLFEPIGLRRTVASAAAEGLARDGVRSRPRPRAARRSPGSSHQAASSGAPQSRCPCPRTMSPASSRRPTAAAT